MPPWNVFNDRTKETSRVLFCEEENGDPLFTEKNGLDIRVPDRDSTRADLPKLSLQEEALRRFQWHNYLLFSSRFKEKLHAIAVREANWDGKDSKAPNSNAINRAMATLDEFLVAVIDNGRAWKTPFVSSDEEGHVTLAWKNGKQELHVDVSEETAEYIKVWGSNIEHEMHVGALKPSEYLRLWDWLN